MEMTSDDMNMLTSPLSEDYGRSKRPLTGVVKHPFFWLCLLTTVYAVTCFAALATWRFAFGMLLSGFHFLASVLCAAGTVWLVRRGMTTSKSAWALYVVGTLLQGALVWRTAVLLRVRFHGNAPTFSTFPEQCHAAEDGPIENCSILRGGGRGNVRLAGLKPPRYNATVEETTAYYHTLITEGVPLRKGGTAWLRELMQCTMVDAQGSLLHARCLTTFMGYPDDLVVSVRCSEEAPHQAEAWIYSQSRQGYWDWMVNSARIRLMVAIQDQRFAKRLDTGNPCGGSSGSGSR